MRSLSQMFGLITEIIFVLAGALLIFVGLTGRYLAAFNARGSAWVLLAVILILWGMRGWRRSRLVAVRNLRFASQVGGISLILVGAIMLSLAWVQLGAAGPLLAMAGVIFVLRGLVTATVLALAS